MDKDIILRDMKEEDIDYYHKHGLEKLYIRTWSGNERMMKVTKIIC